MTARNKLIRPWLLGTVVAVVVVLVLISVFFQNKVGIIDRVNPLVHETTSYTWVGEGERDIHDAHVVNEKGEDRGYTLDFRAYGAEKALSAVHHKGAYVSSLFYPPALQEGIPPAVIKALPEPE